MQGTPESLPYWARLAGALGPVLVGVASVVLTLALAFLYNEQKKLQEAEHYAALDVINWSWDGDELEVDIVNHGKGVAQNVSLTTLAYADNGAHRRYVTKSTVLKRPDQDNPWANAVEPAGNSTKLTGKRRVGELAPLDGSKDWVGIPFATFLQRMKEDGVEELKFCFVIEGVELSKRKAWTLLRHEMMITNPQEYSREEGLGSVTYTNHDGTFDNYFSSSFFSRWSSHLYVKFLRLLSRAPLLGLQPRDLDISGTARVKRMILRRRGRRTLNYVWREMGSIFK